MTRKHFKAIADCIRCLEIGEQERRHVAFSFASILKHENPNFDRARFLAACGIANVQ